MPTLRPAIRDALRGPLSGVGGGGNLAFNPIQLIVPGDVATWLDNDLTSFFSDTARTTPAVADGGIGAWADKTGQGHHYIQATGASQPALKLEGSFYGAEFDGTADLLTCATGGITTGAITIVAVVKQTSGSGDVWGNKNGNNGYRCGMNSAGNDGVMMVGNGTAFTSATVALAASTLGVIAGRYSGTSLTAALNNVAGTPATATLVAGAAAAAMGRAQDFAGAFFAGRIYSLFVINKALTDTQLALLCSYMGRRVGLNF